MQHAQALKGRPTRGQTMPPFQGLVCDAAWLPRARALGYPIVAPSGHCCRLRRFPDYEKIPEKLP